nr:hypothetical protein [Staphylococcus aureus]
MIATLVAIGAGFKLD